MTTTIILCCWRHWSNLKKRESRLPVKSLQSLQKNPAGQICCTFLFSEKQPVVSIVTKNAGETEGTQKTSCLKNIISVAISRGESPLRTKEVCHFFGTIRKFLMLQYNILTFCPLCNHFMVSSKGGFSCGCNILRMRHWSLSWLPAWTPRSWLPKMAAVESVRWEWLWPNPIEPGFWLRLQFSNFGPRCQKRDHFGMVANKPWCTLYSILTCLVDRMSKRKINSVPF